MSIAIICICDSVCLSNVIANQHQLLEKINKEDKSLNSQTKPEQCWAQIVSLILLEDSALYKLFTYLLTYLLIS